MNTPDEFVEELLAIAEADSFGLADECKKYAAILARVRAAAMEEAAKIADQVSKEWDAESDHDPFKDGGAQAASEVELRIRSAAARILEESRG